MSEPKKELAPVSSTPAGGFGDANDFDLIQRVAKMLSASKLIPATFQNNVADCIIGVDLAKRMNAPVLSVMQNMYIVHGKPSWSSQFLIAQINSSRKFSTALQFDYTGEEGSDKRGCYAYAKDHEGKTYKGPTVTMAMAQKEGWVSKSGSKWQTMPELMLAYRAATFFARLYVPEITMGLLTQEEVIDIGPDAYSVKGAKKEPAKPQIED